MSFVIENPFPVRKAQPILNKQKRNARPFLLVVGHACYRGQYRMGLMYISAKLAAGTPRGGRASLNPRIIRFGLIFQINVLITVSFCELFLFLKKKRKTRHICNYTLPLKNLVNIACAHGNNKVALFRKLLCSCTKLLKGMKTFGVFYLFCHLV